MLVLICLEPPLLFFLFSCCKWIESLTWWCFILKYFHDAVRIRYVQSRSDKQLRDPGSERDTSSCKPEDNWNGQPVVPCGLIAWSLFNDTYNFTLNKKQVAVNKVGISWKSDREHKFGKNVFPKNFQKGNFTGGKSLNEKVPVSQNQYLKPFHIYELWRFVLDIRTQSTTVANLKETKLIRLVA